MKVSDLIAGMGSKGLAVGMDELREVVETNNKKRFSFSEDGAHPRRAEPQREAGRLHGHRGDPPARLYHGTAMRNLGAIMKEGLKPMSRIHLHLSKDAETARSVGSRHGNPVVLIVEADKAHAYGIRFYVAENGVWLCDALPANLYALQL